MIHINITESITFKQFKIRLLLKHLTQRQFGADGSQCRLHMLEQNTS